jgi:hypothetical protein
MHSRREENIRKTGKYLIYLFCLFYLVASQKSTLLASSTLFSKETSDTFSELFITFHVLFLIAYLLWFFSKKKIFFFEDLPFLAP